jgi:glycosyltransferase involved in cell wall biosynthesis
MKIAFVSYEYPPETGGGGIGTYVVNAARMLARRDHHVEVFAGGEERSCQTTIEGVRINRVPCRERDIFAEEVTILFAERHSAVTFDVVEGPEYGAEARKIADIFPDLPLVVKLHTSSWLLKSVNVFGPMSTWDKIRFVLGALRRGKLPTDLPWWYSPDEDPERAHVLEADVVAAPSLAIRDWTAETFGLDVGTIRHLPYPFEATEVFLDVPIDTESKVVAFIGRLEMRKGVLDLAEAIPKVLAERPDVRFRIIGRSLPHPRTGEDLKAAMERRISPWLEAVEFTGQVPYEEIPELLADTDVCVFPSHWENFPNVCLEAMSAGRGIVGSRAGGMAEMLDGGNCGNLVSPQRPDALATAVLDLLNNPSRRKKYGRNARKRVLKTYNYKSIALKQIGCYREAINSN